MTNYLAKNLSRNSQPNPFPSSHPFQHLFQLMCSFLSLCRFVANLRVSRVDRSATVVGFRSD
ncbi:unnamed protein product [Onchocerca flexuosa]|uniref:Uncharacterized protein n=1 Tax=Onchocerca flexuosa TaxID=387005 RepID=A0A183HB94_9BILA|nr:unnamed protein product [Onchocerca flexuosa]